MQYGGNQNQQDRMINMMLQARQQQGFAPSFPVGAGAGGPRGLQHPLLHSQQMPGGMMAAAGVGVGGLPASPLYVTQLTENDVLLGRGTPCAENEGNVRFRQLVKQRKLEYIAAEKRMRKDAIAREILQVIAQRGGKFLRKLESKSEMEELGIPRSLNLSFKEVWAVVDEETQVQKVKQALRNKDDTADLIAAEKAKEEGQETGSQGSQGSLSLMTNRFPKGVGEELNKAESRLTFGENLLERASSGSSAEGKDGSSPKRKSKGLGKDATLKKSGAKKDTDKLNKNSLREESGHFASGRLGQTNIGRGAMATGDFHQMPLGLGSPASSRHSVMMPGGVGPADMMRGNNMWDMPGAGLTGAAMMEEERFRNLQELQRMRFMREQGMLGAGGAGMLPTGAGVGADYREMMLRESSMNVDFMQMQAQQQQLQAQRMAAAREQALFPGSSASMGASGLQLHPSTGLAARQLHMDAPAVSSRRNSASALLDTTGDNSAAMKSKSASAGARARAGSDSIGERAVGIAQAMKRADAFSASESLEMSHIETLILSVLCSHGLPAWSPDSHSKAFSIAPSFLSTSRKLSWTWVDFADALKQKVLGTMEGRKGQPPDKQLALFKVAEAAAMDYLKNPRELAITTIMMVEKLYRHSGCSAPGSPPQRKHWNSLGSRIPTWFEQELSRWATTLNVFDSSGRPAPFSSANFLAEHPECQEDPAVMATAAFDPQLADDVVEQIALLTRLRSIFGKSTDREWRTKMDAAIQKLSETSSDDGDSEGSGEKGEHVNKNRDYALTGRLLTDGFAGVLTSTTELGQDHLGIHHKASPTFESLGMPKSAIQQRVSHLTRELHVLDENFQMNQLAGDRMERLAKAVVMSERTAGVGSIGTKRQSPTGALEVDAKKFKGDK